MSVNSFKFVSPGVFVNEIDESQLPKDSPDIGPVVIGRSLKGPMMRPVKVQSFSEFEQLFGLPVAGNTNADVWREGNKLAPTYGAFAAEAYLKNAGPVTFVRLGGFENPDATTAGKAGWATTNTSGSTAATNGGAYGLFISAMSGTTVSGSAKLAAIFYADEASMALSGSALNGTDVVGRAGVWVKSSEPTSKEFKILVTDTNGTATSVVNFDESSKLFIRNVLNTNPTKVNDSITTSPETYWLGETFEREIIGGSGNHAAIIIPLASGSVNASNFKKGAQKASSGWVFGQHKGVSGSWTRDTTSLDGYPTQNLFKLHTLSEDEWSQKNVKISIQDIKISTNTYSPFGSFSVVIRAMNDVDDQPIILERFDQCNLDPASANYIAKKIGDKNTEWDYENRRFKEYGTYENKSRYVRVEVNADVEAGAVDQDLVPFGFYGPETFKTVTVSGDANTPASVSSANSILSTNFWQGVGGISSSSGILATAAFTSSLTFPTLPTVTTSSGNYYLTRPESIYWGMKTTVSSTKQFNKQIPEYLRTKAVSIPDAVKKYAFVFSLDDISGSLADGSSTRYREASWTEGHRASGLSITSRITGSQTLNTLLNSFNKFTMPLAGGFEGLDITEKEPFNNTRALVSTSDETTSYAINSINVAVDAVTDPEVVEMDALVVPGVKNTSIHNKMIAACESRGDAIAIVDVQGDYIPSTENTSAESSRKPVVATAVDYVKNTLALNSSYGCAFFPWVLVRDRHSSNTVWMPPSVVALGTFGSTKKTSEVWFAPAGFTRGGLSETQAGGLSVIGVSQKLNSKERDSLYESNINPIASFPSEGIVIFGQKTLQVTPSALDRINVRRLMNFLKKEVSKISVTLLFDPNTQVTWDRFLGRINPFLTSVQSRLGLEEFRVILDETTTTAELVDRNILYAKIFLKPTRSIEFIALDFTITNTGASFND